MIIMYINHEYFFTNDEGDDDDDDDRRMMSHGMDIVLKRSSHVGMWVLR